MDVKTDFDGNRLIAYLSGEIDHHSAAGMRSAIDSRVEGARPALLILDFTDVNFMDSSGIGLVMGRYKLMKEIGGELQISNPSPHINRVMKLAGLDRLATIGKKNTTRNGGKK